MRDVLLQLLKELCDQSPFPQLEVVNESSPVEEVLSAVADTLDALRVGEVNKYLQKTAYPVNAVNFRLLSSLSILREHESWDNVPNWPLTKRWLAA